MRVENLINLVDGKILNSPSISKFSSITTNPSSVKRGYLYIHYDGKKESLDLALELGAYGVIVTKPFQDSISESAFIKVASIESAIFRILRYTLLKREITLYLSDEISYKLIKKVAIKQNILLPKELDKAFEMLIDCKDGSTFLSSDIVLSNAISIAPKMLDEICYKPLKMLSSTLFTMTIFYDGVVYESLSIPSLFLSKLSLIIEFMEQNFVIFDLFKIEYIDEFYPIFVNRYLEPLKFGLSDMVIVGIDKRALFLEIKEYFTAHSKWGKFIVISNFKTDDDEDIYYLEKIEDFRDILKNIRFNFALIYGLSSNKISNILSIDRAESTLF